MSRNIIEHPEQPGVAVVAEVSYTVLDVAQLEADVNAKQAVVDQLNQEFESLSTRKSEAEAALADSKSDLEASQGIVSPSAQSEEDGASQPDASPEAVGDESTSVSEPSGDTADGAVTVEVQVNEADLY